jgi:cell division protein FtsI/penicillin-binding protein 2
MVVLQPSTGKILAIANNDGYNDDALTARIAPGSTMKVVTATALLNQGLTTQSAVACPTTYTVTGVTFHNSGDESRPAGTPFIDDFAASCDNAFTEKYTMLSNGRLAQTAQNYFGLGKPWDLGLGDPQPYFTLRADAEDSELAAEAFGQGTLGASPLAMASVAATVDTGEFHQPYLVAGAAKTTATPLPGSTATALHSMMRAVITYSDGTAHAVGFGSGVYAKTGTADHGAPGATPNSWLIAYDPAKDLAVGCVVLGGNFGAQAAGPEVLALINAL